jgi:ABC-type lipoprotein release transport system permease subunit
MKDFQLAWRNLWRNKRRTVITAASLFFAVFFALVMRSFQLGAYDRLFMNVVESYTGFLQLQNTDYFDEPVLDNGFILEQSVLDKIRNDVNVEDVIPRLESFALAAAGSRTQGVMVLGIDPDRETKVSDIRKRLVRYRLSPDAIRGLKSENIPDRTKKLLDIFPGESFSSTGQMMSDLGISADDSAIVMPAMRKHAVFSNSYLESSDQSGILLGNGLSEYLKISVGDTLVLMGQGYHGTSAAGTFIVRGVVKLPAPDIDNIIVYLPAGSARNLFAAPGMSTSAVISLHRTDNTNVQETAARLRATVPDPLAVKTWQELNAILVNQMEADNRSGMIMIGILYLIIAFGVFGTMLMMLAERRREFGMLVSIGMQKWRLARVISLEMLLIGLLGVGAGVVASLPVVFLGNAHPLRFTGELARMYEDYGFEAIMPTMLPDTYYLWQIVIVLIILIIAILFSVRKILRINVINALRA